MNSPALLFSLRGRIGQRAFGYAIAGVYGLSFLSQVLISPQLGARWGPLPFVAVQATVTWIWLALHVKRLRDAANPSGLAIAIAILYALAVALFLLLVDPIVGYEVDAVDPAAGRLGFFDLWTFGLVVSASVGAVDFGFFEIFALVVLLLILAPVVIAIGFSIWSGTRPPATSAAAVE